MTLCQKLPLKSSEQPEDGPVWEPTGCHPSTADPLARAESNRQPDQSHWNLPDPEEHAGDNIEASPGHRVLAQEG